MFDSHAVRHYEDGVWWKRAGERWAKFMSKALYHWQLDQHHPQRLDVHTKMASIVSRGSIGDGECWVRMRQ